MQLPRFLGNRIRLPGREWGSPPPSNLHLEVVRFQDSLYGTPMEIYGHSFLNNVVIPGSFRVHEAFKLEVGNQCICPQSAMVTTDRSVQVDIYTGGSRCSEHSFIPGMTDAIGFVDFYLQPYTRLGFDLTNLEREEAHVSCQLVCHVYCRQGVMIWGEAFSTAHIETPEERANREERERIALRERIAREAVAWVELEVMIGQQACAFLKSNPDNWYIFLGSNNQEYAVSGFGQLANVTRGIRYCLQLLGTPSDLPLADIIMEKINWCLLKADDVEKKANYINGFDIGREDILARANDSTLLL